MNNGNNFLSKFSRVAPNTSEFKKVEYSLQLSLGSTTATAKNIWVIANPHATINFEKQSKGLLTLDSWVETNQLDENNRLEKVCTKGFDVPQNGLLFPTGHIKLQESLKQKLYEIVLVKIAVGKSYCVQAQKYNEKLKLPYGFDSIYLYNENEEMTTDTTFKHDYIVFDSHKIMPQYVVHFEFDPKKESHLAAPVCEHCNENVAVLFCKNDEANFCYDCDEEFHQRAGKLANKHIRVPITEKPKTFGNCTIHPDQSLELWDTVDHQPLCVYCKIHGSHSQGEAAGHPLVKIKDAYQKSISQSKDIDPQSEKKKTQLAELLQQVGYRIKDVNKNALFVEERIYQILQEALLQLQEETQRKMSFLIGDQLELKRQYDQLQWMEQFIKYQQEVLPPAEYLNNFSRHLQLRQEFINNTSVPVLTNVQPDMKVEGKVAVVTDRTHTRVDDSQINAIQENDDDQSVVGSSRLRSNIFKQNQINDKNSRLIKNVQEQYTMGPSGIGGSQYHPPQAQPPQQSFAQPGNTQQFGGINQQQQPPSAFQQYGGHQDTLGPQIQAQKGPQQFQPQGVQNGGSKIFKRNEDAFLNQSNDDKNESFKFDMF